MLILKKLFNPRVIMSVMGLLFVFVSWVIFIPEQFGGNLNYVVITGNSMEPLFHKGDLVVAKIQDSYASGDVVVYTHPDIGKVIHRIIDQNGNRFILKGDNNSWVDEYHPTSDEINGKYWFILPKAGSWLVKFREPWIFSLFTGVSVLIIGVSMVYTPMTQKKQKHSSSDLFGTFGYRFTQLKDYYWFPVLFIGLGCLLLGFLSFGKPLQKMVADEIPYTQKGQFSYWGSASQNIYDQDTLRSGDPIFTALTCSATFAFDYQVEPAERVTGRGQYQLNTVLTSPNGWKRTIQQSQPATFEGNSFHVEQSLDLCELQKFLGYVGDTTGVGRQPYVMEIKPVVNYVGALDGSILEAEFSPELRMNVDEKQVYVAGISSVEEENPLLPQMTGSIGLEKTMPNTMKILGLQFPVRTGRIISVAGILLALIGVLLPVILLKKAEKTDLSLGDRLILGQMLMEVKNSPVRADDQVVDLSRLEDLASLAERTGAVVMSLQTPQGTDYYVQNDHTYYRFRKNMVPPSLRN